MEKEKTKFVSGENLDRFASEPFAVELDNDKYILSREVLERNVDICTRKKKDWSHTTLKLLSCEKGKVEFRITSYFDKKSFKLTVQVEPQRLIISCSCATASSKLCRHSYKAISNVLWFYQTSRFFENFRVGGLAETAFAHKKHFNINPVDSGLGIKAKKGIGALFLPNDDVNLQDISQRLSLPVYQNERHNNTNGEALSYIVVRHIKRRTLPFLLPCVGTLNNAGTSIKWFQHFISGTEKKFDHFLSDNQRVLNKLSYEMWSLADKLPGLIVEKKERETDPLKVEALFGLWREAIPLLWGQKHLFFYWFYNKIEFKGKPAKSTIEKARIGCEIPVLTFRLLEKKDLYQLQIEVRVGDRALKRLNLEMTFFVREDDQFWLLSSLRDSALLEWMRQSGNSIVVFKEHFREFEKTVLNRIREFYSVNMIRSHKIASGRKTNKKLK
jgi:hypothetical protein